MKNLLEICHSIINNLMTPPILLVLSLWSIALGYNLIGGISISAAFLSVFYGLNHSA